MQVDGRAWLCQIVNGRHVAAWPKARRGRQALG